MTARLSNAETFRLALAGVLLKIAGAALSPFEAQLVGEVRARWLDQGRATVVTPAEWQVIDDALTAMKASRAGRFLGAAT